MLQEFTAKILKIEEKGGWSYIVVPKEIAKAYGTTYRMQVKGKIDSADYKGSLTHLGDGSYFLPVNAAIRKKIQKEVGESVTVTMELDEKGREVEIPANFQEVLDENPEAKAFFDALSYTNKTRYITWLKRKPKNANENRLTKSIQWLIEGVKDPTTVQKQQS